MSSAGAESGALVDDDVALERVAPSSRKRRSSYQRNWPPVACPRCGADHFAQLDAEDQEFIRRVHSYEKEES